MPTGNGTRAKRAKGVGRIARQGGGDNGTAAQSYLAYCRSLDSFVTASFDLLRWSEQEMLDVSHEFKDVWDAGIRPIVRALRTFAEVSSGHFEGHLFADMLEELRQIPLWRLP
jgi:hypothetical protein